MKIVVVPNVSTGFKNFLVDLNSILYNWNCAAKKNTCSAVFLRNQKNFCRFRKKNSIFFATTQKGCVVTI